MRVRLVQQEVVPRQHETDAHSEREDAAQLEAAVLAKWPDAYARARGIVAGFMASGAGGATQLFNMPEANTPAASLPWASPRSWECAMRVIASSAIHGLPEETEDEWIASHVGTGPLIASRTHLNECDLPVASDFLDSGCKGWSHDPQRLDRTMAVLAACSALLVDPKCAKRDARKDAFWEFMTPIAQQSTDICIPATRNMIASDLADGKAASKPLSAMRPVLKAAGVL